MNETGNTLAPVDLVSIGECRVLRDVVSQPGAETVEGRLVPLMSGEGLRSHMIVMHPGQYCNAHPHDSESIIYTISGRWVFCTTEEGEEKRIVINPGDLFHFPAGVPTGFETPFDEPAIILIAKAGGSSYEEMADGMVKVVGLLAEESANGVPFFYRELPEGHPARLYAIEVTGRDPGAPE